MSADPPNPAVWLLTKASAGGVELTATFALSRAVVREAAELWPHWWHAELFGPPYREAELLPLELLREGLKRIGAVRRRGRRLHATQHGKDILAERDELLHWLADDLDAHDLYLSTLAGEISTTLQTMESATLEELVTLAHAATMRGGWRYAEGEPMSKHDVTAAVIEILARGEGYGLFEGVPGDGPLEHRVTDDGRRALPGVRF